jgi:hypothetical protein
MKSTLPVITAEYRTGNNVILEDRKLEIYKAIIRYISEIGTVNIIEMSDLMDVEPATAKTLVKGAFDWWRENHEHDLAEQVLWVKKQIKDVEDKYESKEVTYHSYLSIKAGLYNMLNTLERTINGEGEVQTNEWILAFGKVKAKTAKLLDTPIHADPQGFNN